MPVRCLTNQQKTWMLPVLGRPMPRTFPTERDELPLRPCLEPGCPTLTTATRCLHHERLLQAAKRAKRPRMRSYAETRRRRTTVAEHRQVFGDWCPGWKRPAHPTAEANPLTADHHTPVGAGGREDGELLVLCLSCNSSRGAGHDSKVDT